MPPGDSSKDGRRTEPSTDAARLATQSQIILDLYAELKEFAVSQAIMRSAITTIEATVTELKNAILATSPESLTMRVAMLERELINYKEWKIEQDNKVRMANNERNRYRQHVKMAITTSILSFLGALIVMLISLVLKH